MFPWRVRILLSLLFCIGICCFGFFVHITSSVQAAYVDTGPISVKDDTTKLDFPKSLDFHITASDTAGKITRGTLFFTTSFGGTEHYAVSVMQPDSTVSLSWHDNLSTSERSYLPASSSLIYYWVVGDDAGHTLTTDSQTVQITDTRFQWQEATQDQVTVHWYNGDAALGNVVLAEAIKDLQSIQQDLGGKLTGPVNLWVYRSQEDFHGAMPAQIHDWAGGRAFFYVHQASIVIENSRDNRLQRDLPHELTHLVFYALTAIGISPVWFDEGMAMYHQIYHEPEMLDRFHKALNEQNLLRLSTIARDFPSDSDKADLAYAQSWQFVDYLYTIYGQQKMQDLIKAMHQKDLAFGEDLVKVLGIDEDHLENQWHLSLHQPATLNDKDGQKPVAKPKVKPVTIDNLSGFLFLLGCAMVFCSLFGLGGLLTYLHRLRQRIAYFQKLAAPLPPLYASYAVNGGQSVAGTAYVDVNSYISPNIYQESSGMSPSENTQSPYASFDQS